MDKKRKSFFINIVLLILGAALLAISFFTARGGYKTATGLCAGIGAGLMAMNISILIIYRYYRNHPHLAKQSVIDSNDERNIAISYKAKAKAFDIMLKVMIIIPFLLILADMPLWLIFASIGLYVFGFGIQIYYTVRYNKEM